MSDPLSAKRDLRRVMDEKRRVLAKNKDAPLLLRDRFLKNISLPPQSIVAFYSALGHEINPALLAAALHDQGHALALPVITRKGHPLIFRSYEFGDPLMKGPMTILEPSPEAPSVEPDILLVPLLAFDAKGYRLGYGGGYYDRTLTALRQKKKIGAIGISYVGQEVPEIPKEPHDARLDTIATEIKVLKNLLP